MDSIIENMYRKRFGISKEDDIKNTKPSCCHCGTQFYHMACCIKGNVSSGKVNILSFGENKYSPSTNLESVRSSIHAEQNAINKLPYTKNPIKINMVVLRFTKKYTLSMSKPCRKCLHHMTNFSPKKGYIIKNVYYSTSDNKIIKTNLSSLCGKNID
jgi:cytidine deaminase